MKRHILGGLLVGGVVLGVGLASLNSPSGGPSAVPSAPVSQTPAALLSAAPVLGGPAPPLARSDAPGTNPPAIRFSSNPPLAPAAFTAFSDWASQFLKGAASATPARGSALAWQRREAMVELIHTNPQQALALSVPFGWRRSLPGSVTRYFEEQVDGRGALNVAVAHREEDQPKVYRQAIIGSQTFDAFVFGRRLAQRSQSDIPLHGIAVDGKLALDTEPIRRLGPDEAHALEQGSSKTPARVCFVCSKPVAAADAIAGELGGEVARFCGTDHLHVVSEHWIKQESGKQGGSASKSSGPWTLGAKSLLYLRVNFPEDLTEPIREDGAYGVMDAVNDFYVENSYDQTSVTTIVTPLLTLPQSKAFYSIAGPFALLSDARAAARSAGFDTDFYDLDIVCHTSVPGFDWGGLGFVGAKGTWLQSAGVGVTAHELGHNYGILHANFWDTSTNNQSGIGPGLNIEYGNIYDTMGAASAGRNHFNAFFKHELQWLPDTAATWATTSGVFRIHCFDLPHRVAGRTYAARIPRDFQRDYWLEMRQQYASDRWLGSGILLNWSPWTESDGGTALIDTTPGSPAASLSRQDCALTIGRTFTDLSAGIHVTPLRQGVEGTNAWMDVQVNLGDFPFNRTPSLTIELDPPNPVPGTLVHFHAAATDPDGDSLAYYWWFNDASFSTNNLAWSSKNFPFAGDYLVRCVVSDMKGGFASANMVVTVGVPSGNRITGQITDTNGVPIEGVRVDNLADTNAPQSVFAYSDSQGRYAIVGVFNDINLSASKYGFTFANLTWTNPIVAGTNMLNADFAATALPVITLVATNYEVAENDSTARTLLLKRTGDTQTNLVVNVHLSGTATLATDYTLAPALASGTNALEFPPGADSLTVTLRTRNDSLIEGQETVTLTLQDDPATAAYVTGSPGYVTMAITDDDASVVPDVSVAAANPLIPENGMDPCEAVFTRSGVTTGDLLVYYTLSGTATPAVDYRIPAGVVLIPSGQSAAKVRISLIDDKALELDETVQLNLQSDSAYRIRNSGAQVTIVDDDVLSVTVSGTDLELSEPAGLGRFTVKRDGDLTANLEVLYSVKGTATAGLDYEPLSGSLTIPAGAASADVIVRALDDSLVEGNESITVNLTNNAGYDVGSPSTATMFIADNERPVVAITAPDNDASEPGENLAAFVISRGSVTSGALAVHVAISGTAINGVDYVPLDNVVVIPNGTNRITLDVIPFDDLHSEPSETIQLVLLPSPDYNLGSPMQASVTIEDEDFYAVPAVGFALSSSSAAESRSPGIRISLSSTSTVPVTVDYRVIGGTAAPGDYVLPPGPLTVDPGVTATVLPLQIRNNATAQPDRTIRLALFDPVGATLDGIRIHTYTILDDDQASLTITATVPNAVEGSPLPGNFRISRNAAGSVDLEVAFEANGDASAPADYQSLGRSAVIPAGAMFVDLPVIPVNDQTVEQAESVTVRLVSAPASTIGSPASATVTIADNEVDLLPVVTVTSTNHPNASESGVPGEFTFHRSAANGELTVFFSVTGSAFSGLDFSALPDSVTFADGQRSLSIPVSAIDDDLLEAEETVRLALTVKDTYRALYPANALVLIQDNEHRVRLDASDFIASEPGINSGEFTFTRFGSTNSDLRVFFTVGGTALNGADYPALSNSFVIPAGQVSAVLPISVLDDRLVEGPETLTLTLISGPQYAFESPSVATITINDDEPMLTLTATVSSVIESSQRPGVLTLTRTGDPRYEFMAYLAVDGSASFGIDYPAFATNVYFECGVSEIDLPIFPIHEPSVEGPELVSAQILPDPAYTILWPSNAIVNIEDAALNQPPVILFNRPGSRQVSLRGPNVMLLLDVSVTDDGGTNTLTNTWTMASGPSSVLFADSDSPSTTVTFANSGFYVIRLTSTDGQLETFVDTSVLVTEGEQLFTDARMYWALDEGSGTLVHDRSGNDRDGVLVGSPSWIVPGILGGALECHGGTDFIRGTNHTNLLNGRKSFSLALWFNSSVTNEDQAIFCADPLATNGTLTLYARKFSTCGMGTNVIEATIRTTEGVSHHVSPSHVLTNGWQHLLLTWSSGGGLSLFINGQPDRPLTRYTPLGGELIHCPEFVIGQGTPDGPSSLRGQIDEVYLFPKTLDDRLANFLGGGYLEDGELANFGPEVSAGPDATVQINFGATLAGMATDDGLPAPPAALSNAWVLVDGPGLVTFTNFNALTNTVQFTQTGSYTFRLIADDGEVATCDEVTITVIEPTRVDLWAGDPEGAELGPDTAEFSFMRFGDLNYDLTVFYTLSGIASNGLDFVPVTNALTLAAGSDTASLLITPYLDHRTEGDQDLTITIVTNSAYTIGNGEATAIIHDSPYGTWTIGYFTLEELTLPAFSGETADFDNDGFINFVEYAANFDPKTVETNAPLVTALESDPDGGPPRVLLTYHRRFPPTDVAYEAAISTDLLSWQTGTNVVEELQAVDDGNGLTETVTARVKTPLSTSTNLFVTVRIWLLSTQP